MVELRDVSLAYPLPRGKKIDALSGINARFEEGKISAIIGPSGCGKTSLIRIMAGLAAPDTGSVSVQGKTAVIFQDYGLLPWKTVFANAALPLRFSRERRGGTAQVTALLEEFGLARFSKQYPHQLSGGMRQRLALVRALVAETEILLMDEPFSSLDAMSAEDARNFLLSLQEERRLTVVIVTHSIEEAAYLADCVYVMRGINPGRLQEKVSAEMVTVTALRQMLGKCP